MNYCVSLCCFLLLPSQVKILLLTSEPEAPLVVMYQFYRLTYNNNMMMDFRIGTMHICTSASLHDEQLFRGTK